MIYEVIFSPKSYKQIEAFDEKLKGRIYAVDKHREEVLVVKIEIKGETTYRL